MQVRRRVRSFQAIVQLSDLAVGCREVRPAQTVQLRSRYQEVYGLLWLAVDTEKGTMNSRYRVHVHTKTKLYSYYRVSECLQATCVARAAVVDIDVGIIF